MKLREKFKILKTLLIIPKYLKLVYYLLKDERVPLYLKILTFGVISYFLFPFDIIPDVFPVSGYVDDLILIFLILERFILWCPENVVRENFENLNLDRETFLKDFSLIKSTYSKIYEFIKNNFEEIVKKYSK
jgi:uncharacterized membrane protein YkvA (DUF1232 family)